MEENKIERVEKLDKKKKITLSILAVVIAIIYIVFSVIIFSEWISLSLAPDSNEKQLSIGFFLAFIVIAIGICAFGVTALISLIGWITSAIWHKKSGNAKGWKIYFIIMTFLPIVTETIAIIITKAL